MKVLMFGWEFPPHISGGLGTACYGLTKAMSKSKDLDIIFVVPKLFGDEDSGVANLISAEDIKMDFLNTKQSDLYKNNSIENISEKIENTNDSNLYQINDYFNNITKIEINSLLNPYLTPENFEAYIQNIGLKTENVRITKEGKIVYIENGEIREIQLEKSAATTYIEEGKYKFSGKYGPNLIDEVRNYAKIAAKIALAHDFDIIHAHDWLTYLAGIEAKKMTGKPLVIHVHATEFDRSGENVNQLVYDIEREGMKNADTIITVSNLTRKTVIERYGQNSNKIKTVYNAVEPVAHTAPRFRKKIDCKIVTFLGRITFQKGPEYFIEAAKLVLEKEKNVRFVMAGSGDMLQRMINHAASLRIGDNFHFTNFLKGDDVKRMFDISDVYVMPSVSEPFGISPLEAMRSNVPVIISKQSGVAEILKHAIKVDFWDTYAIADAIYGLIKYNGLSKMFKEFGKQEVDNLKWENSAKAVKEIYYNILNQN